MATIDTGSVASTDTGYFALQFSKKLYYEGVAANPLMKVLMNNGCVNIENSLTNENGGTVYMQNALRANTPGVRGDVDMYSSAAVLEKANRSLNIALVSNPVTWPMKGTQTQQYVAFDLSSPVVDTVTDWVKGIISASLINQAAGNTATTITQYATNDSGFTGSDLTTITGMNACAVPTYHYAASSGGAITTDASINSSNTLTLKDLQNAATIITSQQQSKPTWQTLKNKSYLAVCFISYTGMYQLENDAVTAGQGMQLSQVINANLAGGKTMDLKQFELPGLPYLFVLVPDSWLPRGVTLSSGAETAATRRCVIVGRNCLDVAFGKGFSGAGKVMPGINVEMDTSYKKLNKQGYAAAKLLWGAKKTQQTGIGSGNSTSYDVSSFVLTHYSAT